MQPIVTHNNIKSNKLIKEEIKKVNQSIKKKVSFKKLTWNKREANN